MGESPIKVLEFKKKILFRIYPIKVEIAYC